LVVVDKGGSVHEQCGSTIYPGSSDSPASP
jgi:hypothetical protein